MDKKWAEYIKTFPRGERREAWRNQKYAMWAKDLKGDRAERRRIWKASWQKFKVS